MVPGRRKELKLIAAAALLLVVSLLLMSKAESAAAGRSLCPCSCHQHGGAAARLLHQGRRMLAGRGRHGEVLANGLMEHANKEGGDAIIGEEEKREVITGPNPLHNRR
uniref:Uncharacterized protein n=1 Tax=Zea mays TaxID=4577 RepID=A0A804LKS5_MAIZE